MPKILILQATKEDPFSLVLDTGGSRLTTASPIVQLAASAAFGVNADVTVETVSGTSEILRLDPFTVDSTTMTGCVTRLGTQRQNGVDVLEIFVWGGKTTGEVAYRTSDLSIVAVFLAAIQRKEP